MRPTDPTLDVLLKEMVDDTVAALGGSFLPEHGRGLAERGTMLRRKSAVAMEVMRAIKTAMIPKEILNPGKVVPE